MKTYSTSALVALIIISFAPLNGCKQKKSTFKVPHIPTIYGNNLSKVLAFDEDNVFLTGAFGYAARTTQGSQIRYENSKKNFWEVQDTGLKDELFCDASFPTPIMGGSWVSWVPSGTLPMEARPGNGRKVALISTSSRSFF